MAHLAPVPFFFGPIETLSDEERIKQRRLEQAEIKHWKYRFLKMDIKAGETIAAYQIRCLNKRLVHLELEKRQKQLRVKISTAAVHRRQGESSRIKILRLLDEVATIEAKVKAVQIDMIELKSQIKRSDAELKDSTKAVPADYAYSQALGRSVNVLTAMQNRLHHARSLEGKLHTENRNLRTNIEGMLSERKRYNLLWMEYVRQLNHNRKFLLDMIERATLAFNQGEDLCHRIEHLQAQQLREKRSRLQEMVDIERQIVTARQANEFLRTKGFQRPVAELNPLLVRKRELFKHAHREKIHTYGAALNNTRNAQLNIEDIKNMLLAIEKQQDKYMALFKYMNFTNARIDEANGMARQLEKDVGRLRESERRAAFFAKSKAKQTLQHLQTAQQQTKKMREEEKSQHASLELKLSIVEQALSVVGYDRVTIAHLMRGPSSSDGSRMAEGILKKALTTIERKVLDMVRMCSYEPASTKDIAISDLYDRQQCAECAEGQDVNQHDERIVAPLEYVQLVENVRKRANAPEMQYRLHTLSQCKMPGSRMLVNKRYQ